MAFHITEHRRGFELGKTLVTRLGEEDDTGIELSVLKLAAGNDLELRAESETAFLLMEGSVDVELDGKAASWHRRSLFDESPSCAHFAAGSRLVLHATSSVEFTVYRVDNQQAFESRLFDPSAVANEHRGKGQVKDACYRFVRTIFDATTSAPETDLVLGEVITMPGRWSSYPPHHHPQPEIYHYRFTLPQGYGHAELGEDVLKVRAFDTVKIFGPNDHAQTAAPGYGMYYSWAIRNLPNQRYSIPEFTEEHRWIMEPDASVWWPGGVD